MRVIAFLFLSLFSLSANPYFQILEALNEEKGDFLQDEIEIHKSRLEPRDTGHLHTAISVIKRRIEEIT